MAEKKECIMLMVTIVERRRGILLSELYAENGVGWHYQSVGLGTASSELLNVLGFGTVERDILFSMGTQTTIRRLMYNLNNDFRSNVHAKGIVFSIPLTGINNLAASFMTKCAEMNSEKGEDNTMQNGQHSLILVAVNQGYTDDVMEAARKAGARGGTILRARWLGSEESEHFFGITLQAEKEIIAMVVPGQNRNIIMETINLEYGITSEAGAFICSLGIEQVIRLT